MVDESPEIDKQELANELYATGLFKEKTEYIKIGDEPLGGSGVVNLNSMLSANDISGLKQLLTFMPRMLFRDWFMKKVWPSIPSAFDPNLPIMYYADRNKKPFEDLIWAAFIEVFNEANLEHINKEKLEPWDWEAKKTEAYYVSQNEPELAKLENQFSEMGDIALLLDPKAKVIMEQYAMLPKIGDVGMEINRQLSIKELLKQKDYETAQAIVDAFRYAVDTVIGDTITQPIPFNIVAADGSAIVKRS